jgi:NAD(P)-dependent dehydrogenase (short-subunit alcohol dehydrogenase family)
VLVGYGGNADAAEARSPPTARHRPRPVHLDVTDEDSGRPPPSPGHRARHAGGVVNNAGVADDDLLLRLDPARFDRTIEVNLRGAYLVSRAALRPMLRARHGRIVNVASVVALRGNAGQTAYAASKAG